MFLNDEFNKIKHTILESIPKDASVSDIEFEGPEIAIYSRNPKVLLNNGDIIKVLAKRLRKRLVIRSDPALRMPPQQAEAEIKKIVPEEAEISSINFDDNVGEVIIEAKKPGLVIGRNGTTLKEITRKIFWRPSVIRTPPIQSRIVLQLRHALQKDSEKRRGILKTIGQRIHRSVIMRNGWLRFTALGGFREVGRTCLFVQTAESNVLIDCGINVGTSSQGNSFPRLDMPEFDLDELDAVIITHAHLDHCLPPDTPIRMADGRWKPIVDVEPGEQVTSFNWETGEFEPAKCTGKTVTNGHQEILEIITPYHQLVASPNHRFFTIQELEVREVEAQDLQEGMLLPIQRPIMVEKTSPVKLVTDIQYEGLIPLTTDIGEFLRELRLKRHLKQAQVAKSVGVHVNTISKIETNPTSTTLPVIRAITEFYNIEWKTFAEKFEFPRLPETLTPELARLVGYIQGDGHKSNEYSFRITEMDQMLILSYSRLITQLFRVKPSVRERKDTQTPTYTISVNNAQILRFLESNFSTIFSKSKDLEVPEIIQDAPLSIKQEYLKGLFDAEGTVVIGIKFCSYSHKLLRQVQFLLYQLDIPSSVHLKGNVIRLASPYALKRFSELVGFTAPTKNKKLEKRLSSFSDERFVYPSSLIPISSKDLETILREIGILGRIHNSPRITELPMAILDWYRRKKGYVTRPTVEQLLEVLLERYNSIELLKGTLKHNLLTARQQLTIPRSIVAEATGLSTMQIQYREEGNLYDFATEEIEEFLKTQIDRIQDSIRDIVQKIHHILTLNVEWHRIKRINSSPNTKPLIDIEVQPNRSFVAKGIVIHNCGFVPFLYKYGYRGPVYCTKATRNLMTLLQLDYLDVAEREGKLSPYKQKDVKSVVLNTIPLDYGEVTDISPDVRLTLHNAGHILGSSISHLHIGDGLYNVAYTGDFKFSKSRLLEAATSHFPRLETLILESTYGNVDDNLPSRRESERRLIHAINRTIQQRGKVLIPVLAVGRAQEIIVLLEEAIRHKIMEEVPIFIEGMISEATAIHTTHPEYLAHDLRDKIFHYGLNPFLADCFTQVDSSKARPDIVEGEPCVILATSGMLSGGPSVDYFRYLAPDPKNTVIFVSYQIEGTLGRRIQKGQKEIPMTGGKNSKPQIVKVALNIETVEGFSGHSDRRQLINYTKQVTPRPEKVITCHGEKSKCIGLAKSLKKILRTETHAPTNLETLRLV
ncbi:beta-CASP ribonuclease aCPSF1 [Candidatus Borrarchaeum sp.]|uniref:beta-CASP ribonuclease aCPSF1 n=1 Tax=Candidatus Borrarchaeum sp. TaxID=2846742 RepID=UPI00257EA5D5|nr:beta-CASP ribonuclease aCPSF1 [Candidatus Borrarchaeum sp.]